MLGSLVFIVLFILSNNGYIIKNAFILTILVIILFIQLYLYIRYLPIGELINYTSQSIFNKNFYSGRDSILLALMDYILDKPLIGYGLGVYSSDLIDIDLSAHNWYIQMVIQFGIIGLILIISLLYLIYNYCYNMIHNSYVGKIIISFIPAILIQETFEVMLTQNHLSIGLIVWMILGISHNKVFIDNP